jgi:hypothetical protein
MGQPMSTWKTEEERGALEADMPAARALASDTQERCQDPEVAVVRGRAHGPGGRGRTDRQDAATRLLLVMRPSVRRRDTGPSCTLPAERTKTHLCVGF